MSSAVMHTSLSRRTLSTVTLCALFLLITAGCAVVTGGVQTPENPPEGASVLGGGRSVSAVQVELDGSQLTGEVAQVATDYEIPRILTNRINDHLTTNTRGNLEVDVKVIGLRLRSNGTAIWWGVMAGGDWITVDVQVKEGGRTIKQFQTGTGTALGGFAFGGRSTRVGRMMKTLGERITEGI